MDLVSTCVAFIAAIVGLALPISVEVIARINEKYKSQAILDLFLKEPERKHFNISLILSLLSIVYWYLAPPAPKLQLIWLQKTFDNSAAILLAVFTLYLVTSFLFLILRIKCFYLPTELIPYAVKKHNSQKVEVESPYFQLMSDLIIITIREGNETVAKTLSDFFYESYKRLRNKAGNNHIEYPRSYYDLVSRIIEEMALIQSKRIYFLANYTGGGIWLLGEFSNAKISPITYQWLWSNIKLSLSYERQDFVEMYWENSHQYKRYYAFDIQPEIGDDYTIINQAQIDEAKQELKTFVYFHYFLGGLLVYQGRFKLLKRLWSYTQSIPPQYELLPETLDEIFEAYFAVMDQFNPEYTWLSQKFSFPEISGLNADGNIRKWFGNYLSLLFLRQYTLQVYYVYQDPLRIPQVPTSLIEKKRVLKFIPWLKEQVNAVLVDRIGLIDMGLGKLDESWFSENNRESPTSILDQYEQNIKDSIDHTEKNQELVLAKVLSFFDSTTTTILPTLNEIIKIKNNSNSNIDKNTWWIKPRRTVISKGPFVEESDTTYFGFDSTLSSGLERTIKQAIGELFFQSHTLSYTLPIQNLENAIKKLTSKVSIEEYVMVSFGVSLEELNLNSEFKQRLIYLSFKSPQVGQSIYILKASDLPSFNFHSPSEEIQKKFELVNLETPFNIFAAVIDLNKRPDLISEIGSSRDGDDFQKSVLLEIFIELEIDWSKNIRCVQLLKQDPFSRQGMMQSVSEVDADYFI